MASPQTDNGYTAISNELLDAIICRPFPKNARSIIDLVMRQTYGYRRKTAPISRSFICSATRLDIGSVNRSIRYLLFHRILTGSCKPNGTQQQVTTYSIQKDYELWTILPRGTTAPIYPQPVDNLCITTLGALPPLGAFPCGEVGAFPCGEVGALPPHKKSKIKNKTARARANYLSISNINNLKSLFTNVQSLKNHLLELKYTECEIDAAIGKVF